MWFFNVKLKYCFLKKLFIEYIIFSFNYAYQILGDVYRIVIINYINTLPDLAPI